ncbi:hypothetical protein AX14_005327 [Amanita brunnescens Koide BX004]|nr:hypothetical protein AX14_005327 [Amanita brunnescens Koide BX004]
MSDDEFCFSNPINHSKGKWNRLLPIPQSDPVFKQLEQQFSDGWKHLDKERPPVQAIFKILFSEDNLEQYTQYRTKVAGTFFFNFFTQSNGNEQLLFHGTTRGCALGEDGNSVYLCNLPDCLLCNVIRNSFDVEKCGLKNKFRRFGSGIYVTACSSKADDYSKNTSKKAAFRVLLVNRVVVGKPYKRLHNATNLTEPPSGYHSVFGEPGGDLNYEETVVYNNDAIRPAYLVVYGQPPRQSIFTKLFKTPLAS